MNNIKITILTAILLLVLPLISGPSEQYKTFISKEYDPNDFNISQAEFRNGNVLIRIIEAKKISKKYDEPPHLCRAWLDVQKANETIFQKYFDDIDAVGFSYGLFVPKAQPPSPYFVVVKNGDYDGRLFIVCKDGRVFNLLGGFYFISKDKRYLFSEYASDARGLAVFDLQNGRVVFSSEKLPAYMHQWYEKDGKYFFTEAEWNNGPGIAHEKEDVAYFYDFKTNKIIEKRIETSYLATSKPVKYDFDPREYEDCAATQNKRLDSDRK